jgi:small-conductance mechanosensitive channel
MPQSLIKYVPTILNTFFSIVVIVLAWIVYRVARRVLASRIKDKTHLFTLRVLVRNAFIFIASVVILLIWLGLGSNFTVAMGILGAGIAFASQELIGSFTGYLNIVTGSIYRIGDRVRVGDVTGDVMDISILRTTLMEIGEWVKADQYTGRIVSIANRAVFSGPVFNYTQYWHYLWDEIMIPITYTSDWRRAAELMLEHGREYSTHIQADAQAEFEEMVKRYLVHETPVEPALYIVMTDNWIEMTLRYIVDVRARRQVRARLHQELLRHFESEANMQVASATFEIVGLPQLRVNVGRGTEPHEPPGEQGERA